MRNSYNKNNFKEEFYNLLKEYPEVVSVMPILIAVRDKEISILNDDLNLEKLDFSEKNTLTDEEIEKYYEFFNKTGLEHLLKEGRIRNLVDYVFGIEVGLDTNARKNRTGKIMEKIVGRIIEKICNNYNFLEYFSQMKGKDIIDKWKINLNQDENRIFDFVVYNKKSGKIYIIEVNFYNTGGSKLKATAGEYTTLNERLLKNNNLEFIWITDGKGWESSKNSLKDCYNKGVKILNLHNI